MKIMGEAVAMVSFAVCTFIVSLNPVGLRTTVFEGQQAGRKLKLPSRNLTSTGMASLTGRNSNRFVSMGLSLNVHAIFLRIYIEHMLRIYKLGLS